MKDDFFDQLSCEALEKLRIREAAEKGMDDGRGRFVDQRRLDIETFGGLGAVRHQAYGGGRGRGPPGRGGGGGRVSEGGLKRWRGGGGYS